METVVRSTRGMDWLDWFLSVVFAIAAGSLTSLAIAAICWAICNGGWLFGFKGLWLLWWSTISYLALDYFVHCCKLSEPA